MIIPDINLLLYAYDADSPFHARAKQWWQESLSGTETVGLPHVVIFGFVRVATNARIFRQPMGVTEAIGHVRSWSAQPVVEALFGGRGHHERALKLLEDLGVAGNLVTDAQLAALAVEHNGVLYTADADFIRFPDLLWENPITGAGSRRLKKRSSRTGPK